MLSHQEPETTDTPSTLENIPMSQGEPLLPPTEEGTPRLVIHKMVLNNFKSYAGRVEIGPFHKVSHKEYFQLCI